jgi:hypothetical protein
MAIDPDATIEEALYTLIQSEASITALVGTRVYPIRMAQNPTYPTLVYSLVSTRNLELLSGDGGMYWPRYQIDSYARTYRAAKRLARTVRLALTGYSGTVGSIDICRIGLSNEVDDFEPVAGIYHVATDFIVQYK